jgi:hypothetical protein
MSRSFGPVFAGTPVQGPRLAARGHAKVRVPAKETPSSAAHFRANSIVQQFIPTQLVQKFIAFMQPEGLSPNSQNLESKLDRKQLNAVHNFAPDFFIHFRMFFKRNSQSGLESVSVCVSSAENLNSF